MRSISDRASRDTARTRTSTATGLLISRTSCSSRSSSKPRLPRLETALPRHHRETALPRHHRETALPRHHRETALPRHHRETALPRHHRETALPRHHRETALPRHHRETVLRRHHRETALPRHHRETVLPPPGDGSTPPPPGDGSTPPPPGDGSTPGPGLGGDTEQPTGGIDRDFRDFSASFNKREGQPGFEARFDFNSDRAVDFTDFVQFAEQSGGAIRISLPAGIRRRGRRDSTPASTSTLTTSLISMIFFSSLLALKMWYRAIVRHPLDQEPMVRHPLEQEPTKRPMIVMACPMTSFSKVLPTLDRG